MCAQSEGVRHLDRERVQARCDVSYACSVRSCTVPEASASCRSRLRPYHGIILFLGPMKAPRAG